jgi:hypothetical protein
MLEVPQVVVRPEEPKTVTERRLLLPANVVREKAFSTQKSELLYEEAKKYLPSGAS